MIYVLFIWLVQACFFDYSRDRIPNALVLTGLLPACVYQALQGGIGLLCIRMVLVLFFLYPLYMPGMLGAGDIKLYCMSAAYLGGRDCILFFSLSLLCTAAASFLKMLFLGNLRERICYFFSYVVDVVRKRRFTLYQKGICFERGKGTLHMTGPMLIGFLLYLCVTRQTLLWNL